MKFQAIVCFCIAILFLGCFTDSAFIENNDADFVVPMIVPSGSEKYISESSDYIFDQDKLHTIELKIPGSALNRLDKDPSAEEYEEGMLIFEGDTISPVGIRYKGSVGAWVGCLSGSNVFNPSGFKTCTKLSMKIKINWDGRDDKFFKLKKLQLHSQNHDKSQMRERLGYWFFREMGVPAPRSVHARLVVNDQFMGVFALTEQIDGRFVKYRYEDDDGNLYKEIWPLSKEGEPYPDQAYVDALKTNEGENVNIDLIKNFGEMIASTNNDQGRDILESRMDINEIISYSVIDRTIRHDDGPFHWYCNGNNCSNHNYYWYEEPNNERLHLIPWDLDNAFENIISNENVITSIADEWGEVSNDCKPFKYLAARQWSASCDKLTALWSSYNEEYEQKKMEFINGPLTPAITNSMLDQWYNQIKESTIEASGIHEDAITVDEWESAFIELKTQLDFARSN